MARKTEEVEAIFIRERQRWAETTITTCIKNEDAEQYAKIEKRGLYSAAGSSIEELEQTIKLDCDEGELEPGLTYRFFGSWVKHWKYGDQFHCKTFTKITPHDRTGIINYLMKAPGIGKGRAEKLWQAYHGDAVRMLRENPIEAAGKVAGKQSVPVEQKFKEAAAYLEQEKDLEDATIDIVSLLAGRGFPKRLARETISTFGNLAAEKVRKNPYKLMRFKGVGFLRADAMYLDLGGNPVRLKRQALAIWHGIANDFNGHTWFGVSFVKEMLREKIAGVDADPLRAIRLCLRSHLLEVYKDLLRQPWFCTRRMSADEQDIARGLAFLATRDSAWPSVLMVGLSDHQEQQLEIALSKPVGIFAGDPGCLDAGTVLLIKTSDQRPGGRSYTVEDAFYKFHKIWRYGAARGRNRFWSGRAQTLSYNESNRVIEFNEIQDIVDSGVKEIFEVISFGGRTLRATSEHPFRVPDGTVGADSEGFKQLCNLQVGDRVMVRREGMKPLVKFKSTRKIHRRERCVPGHPNGRRKVVTGSSGSYEYNLVRESRLVIEAARNGLRIETFISAIASSPSAQMYFLPKEIEVHHKDGDLTNNDLLNLELLSKSDHAKIHGPKNQRHFGNIHAEEDGISSIRSVGNRQTYDVVMLGVDKNYVADGFIVHNTGKSFAAARLVSRIADLKGYSDIAVIAPTGKAAVRVTEAMAECGVSIRAKTVHSLLRVASYEGGAWTFEHNRENPIEERYVVVDESSMLDVPILASLVRALRNDGHLLLVGDLQQLPPVGHGAPLRDLLAASVPFGNLTEIRRNSGAIVEMCQAIREERSVKLIDRINLDVGNNIAIRRATDQEAARKIESLVVAVRDRKLCDATWDLQVIVAVNDKSDLSRKKLNKALQLELNSRNKAKPLFWNDDKIVCLRNQMLPVDVDAMEMVDDDLEGMTGETAAGDVAAYVANGEIGKVIAVYPNKLILEFFTPKRIVVCPVAPGSDPEGFDLGYAISCHKSQGSQWKVVIVALDPSGGARRICDRSWVYTAISRAQEICFLVGRDQILTQFCRTQKIDKRKTFLVDRFREAIREFEDEEGKEDREEESKAQSEETKEEGTEG